MKSEVLDKLDVFRNDINEKIESTQITAFRLQNLDVKDDSIVYGDAVLSQKALTQICDVLRIKPQFLKYKRELEDTEWQELYNIITNTQPDAEFWSFKSKNDNGLVIPNIYTKNDKTNFTHLRDAFQNNFEAITETISSANMDIELKGVKFDEDSHKITMDFLKSDSDFEINGLSDVWKTGLHINFDGLEFNAQHFLERLVCTNGAVNKKQGFATNLAKSNYNQEVIIRKLGHILNNDTSLVEWTQRQTTKMLNTNASVFEFMNFRKFFLSRNTDDVYQNVIDKTFSLNPIIAAYQIDLNEKSKKWLKSASSGKNAYDLFNDMTYISSHADKFNMSQQDSLSLQVNASNYLFSKEFDLYDVPQLVDFKVDKTYRD